MQNDIQAITYLLVTYGIVPVLINQTIIFFQVFWINLHYTKTWIASTVAKNTTSTATILWFNCLKTNKENYCIMKSI
jgi:hypothetical protein